MGRVGGVFCSPTYKVDFGLVVVVFGKCLETMFRREVVNLSKRGGKDGVFQGLTGLLRLRLCQPEENFDSFTQI